MQDADKRTASSERTKGPEQVSVGGAGATAARAWNFGEVLSILLTSVWTPSGSTSVQGPWEHNSVIRPKA